MFKRLKNTEDNLEEVDNNDNEVGTFRMIKDIKDRGIKIDNDDEAVRKIRERIKELIDDGIIVNNFDEMKKEIIDHEKKKKNQGSDVKVEEDQINDLINKIFNKTYGKYERKTYIESEIDNFFKKYGDKNISISYDNNKNKFNTEEITKLLIKLRNKLIGVKEFKKEYDKFIDNIVKFEYFKSTKKEGSISPNQKKKKKKREDMREI